VNISTPARRHFANELEYPRRNVNHFPKRVASPSRLSIMNFSIEHIGLAASNPLALKTWYEQALGARVIWENDATPRTYLLKLAEGAMLEIYPADSADTAHRGDNKVAGFRHLAWRVNSIEKAKSELQGRGVKLDDEVRPAAGGGKVLFFSDAEGNLLHLVERPAAETGN
jgi:glyoxylase I family protein